MTENVEKILGHHIPAEEIRANRGRYLLPTALFLLAALLLLVSVFQPYWHMTPLRRSIPRV